MLRPAVTAAFLLAIMQIDAVAVDETGEQAWLTRSGHYRVSYTSELEPVVINQIHNWVFHIETAQGITVDNAIVSVSGGMPQHNHGLPTRPRMIKFLGNGDYILAGMRFHMNGFWELAVTVEADGRHDTVVIPLTI